MYTEFGQDEEFEGPYPTDRDVLAFYEIEDVNRSHDMIYSCRYVRETSVCSGFSAQF